MFYRGDDVDFVGDQVESLDHYKITLDHLRWLAAPTAKRRAEKSPESRKLFAIKIDQDKIDEVEE